MTATPRRHPPLASLSPTSSPATVAPSESGYKPDLNAAIVVAQDVPFPSPKDLAAAATKARLTADIPWRRSRTGSDHLAIYRNFNGASGNYVSSAQMLGKSTMEYNEVNCMLEGPTVDRVDRVTVEAECYNQAQAHLQNTLLIFVAVLKEIDSELPTDALDRLGAAMVRPQMIGRWKVEAKVHQAGADIVATMQR